MVAVTGLAATVDRCLTVVIVALGAGPRVTRLAHRVALLQGADAEGSRYHGTVRILGISKAMTASGKIIRDGGAAIYENGQITAVTEAGITGRKHAGGYEAALRYLSEKLDIDVDKDFDYIAVSTCCESEELAGSGHSPGGP